MVKNRSKIRRLKLVSSRAGATSRKPSWINNGILALAAQAVVAKFVETFKEFPPIQKPNTFTVDDALAMMGEAASS